MDVVKATEEEYPISRKLLIQVLQAEDIGLTEAEATYGADNAGVDYNEQAKKVADEYNMKLFEVSAKTNKNINEVFDYLTMEILKNIDKVEDLKSEALVKDKKKTRGCCK